MSIENSNENKSITNKVKYSAELKATAELFLLHALNPESKDIDISMDMKIEAAMHIINDLPWYEQIVGFEDNDQSGVKDDK